MFTQLNFKGFRMLKTSAYLNEKRISEDKVCDLLEIKPKMLSARCSNAIYNFKVEKSETN